MQQHIRDNTIPAKLNCCVLEIAILSGLPLPFQSGKILAA